MTHDEQPQYLYLTTTGRRSGQPRQIEIWFTERAGRYYVIAEHRHSNWVRNVMASPAVAVRVNGESFPARARFVEAEVEPELSAVVQGLSREKYGWGDGLVVEIIPD